MSTAEGKRAIFFLGATGFLGSEVLILLANELPNFHIQVLVRTPIKEKEDQLKAIYNDLSVVEGTLEDAGIIEEEVAKADITINYASSDHWLSVKVTLAGLKNSASNPGKPSLYIHVSGLGITSDNCRGEHVELEDIPCYTDIGFKLEDCPPYNKHLESDKPIVQAGTRNENPVRTIIVFPGWIYGVGRDFAVSDEPRLTNRDIVAKVGDVMHAKGLIREPGSQPLPDEIVEPLGFYGWSLLAGNQITRPGRLFKWGWEPTETKKLSLMDSITDEIELVLKNGTTV